MMRGQRPGNGASEIMPNPDGWASTKMVMQFDHIVDNLFQGIGVGVGR